jgi:hypothetical protein
MTLSTKPPTTPLLKKPAPTKDTLRPLTPSELRLVAGGLGCAKGHHMPDAD